MTDAKASYTSSVTFGDSFSSRRSLDNFSTKLQFILLKGITVLKYYIKYKCIIYLISHTLCAFSQKNNYVFSYINKNILSC